MRSKYILLTLPIITALFFAYIPRGRLHFELEPQHYNIEGQASRSQLEKISQDSDYLNKHYNNWSFGFPVKWSEDRVASRSYVVSGSTKTSLDAYLNITSADKKFAIKVDLIFGFVLGSVIAGIVYSRPIINVRSRGK